MTVSDPTPNPRGTAPFFEHQIGIPKDQLPLFTKLFGHDIDGVTAGSIKRLMDGDHTYAELLHLLVFVFTNATRQSFDDVTLMRAVAAALAVKDFQTTTTAEFLQAINIEPGQELLSALHTWLGSSVPAWLGREVLKMWTSARTRDVFQERLAALFLRHDLAGSGVEAALKGYAADEAATLISNAAPEPPGRRPMPAPRPPADE